MVFAARSHTIGNLAGMFGAVKHGFRSLATLKLAVYCYRRTLNRKEHCSCGIARFPCDNTAFLFYKRCYRLPLPPAVVSVVDP